MDFQDGMDGQFGQKMENLCLVRKKKVVGIS